MERTLPYHQAQIRAPGFGKLSAALRGRTERRRDRMPRVEMGAPAPDFDLEDFSGVSVRLSDFRGEKHVLLVFNRGFT